MDFYKSCLLAECPDAMIEELEKDALFMSRIKVEEALKEKELLERHEQAMLLAAMKGNTNALQWKLERLDPDRWASGRRGEDEGKEKVKIYIPKNGRSVNEDD